MLIQEAPRRQYSWGGCGRLSGFSNTDICERVARFMTPSFPAGSCLGPRSGCSGHDAALYEPIIEQTFSTQKDTEAMVAVPSSPRTSRAREISSTLPTLVWPPRSASSTRSPTLRAVGADVEASPTASASTTGSAAGSSTQASAGGIVLHQGRLGLALHRPRVRPRARLLDAASEVNERQRKRALQAPARPATPSKQARGPPRAGLQAQHRRPAPKPRAWR